MGFEKFKPVKRRSEVPSITVSRNNFAINVPCKKEYFKDKGFAELYFDEKEKKIGIKPLKNEASDSVRVRYYQIGGISLIAASGFIKRYGIDKYLSFSRYDEIKKSNVETSIPIPVEWDDKEKMILLKLPDKARDSE